MSMEIQHPNGSTEVRLSHDGKIDEIRQGLSDVTCQQAHDSARIREIEKKVNEIHDMLTQFGQAVEQLANNPMVKAMLPPGMLGK